MRFAHPEQVAQWPKPNFVDPETRGPAIYIIYAISASTGTLTLALRLYVRMFQRRWVGLDDYFLMIAWLAIMGDMATVLWGFRRFDWDRHFWDSYHVEYLIPGAKAVMAAKTFFAVASSFIRFSLLVLYYRLLAHINASQRRTWKWVLYAATVYNIGVFLSYIFTITFACADPSQYFQWPGTGYCIDEVSSQTALAALNTFAEALIAALPIPVILSMDMEPAQRRTVFKLLCLGFLVSVVGMVRTYYVYTLFNSDDLTWYAAPHWICSEVEMCTAMFCACAPALRSFIGRTFWNEKVVPLTRRSTNRTRKQRSSNGNSYGSKGSITGNEVEQGWVPPTHQYQYDLEGIGVDGFGYTVKISGPLRRRRGITGWFRNSAVLESTEQLPTWRIPPRHDNGAGSSASDAHELRKTPSQGIVETHDISKTIS